MNGPDRRERGLSAEDRACRHLQSHGLQVRERNFHTRRGEIDLIMEDGDTLVFVEVRYRADSTRGSALETVGPRKRRRLVHAASTYLQHRRLNCPCRFDVVAINGDSLEWVANAFDAA